MNTEITDYKEWPAWFVMWLIALAIFGACKWLTWCRSCVSGLSPTFGRSLAYLFAWPGMDAAAFLQNSEPAPAESLNFKLQTPEKFQIQSSKHEARSRFGNCCLKFLWSFEFRVWSLAAAKTLTGATLIAFAAHLSICDHTLLIGWLGMIGLVLFLHFGLFELLALGWQRAGVNAQPLMRAPLRATSLADFWSRRWNTAFHQLAHEFAFRPIARRLGAKAAILAVFLISGLVHELVISVPARGGFGLPTAYFLLQGVGVLAERSQWGRGVGLSRGWRGWLFVMGFTAGPAFFLFHPPFIHHVILPMLRFIAAS